MDELFGDGQIQSAYSKEKGKQFALKIACLTAAMIICAAFIVVSAILLAMYSPDETSSTISLTPAVGWVIIACFAVVMSGIIITLIILKLRKK